MNQKVCAFFDNVQFKNKVKNDAQFSRDLGVAPPVISKMRSGGIPVGPTIILRIHETYGTPVKEIRAALAED